jgi:hypothetical protein
MNVIISTWQPEQMPCLAAILIGGSSISYLLTLDLKFSLIIHHVIYAVQVWEIYNFARHFYEMGDGTEA